MKLLYNPASPFARKCLVVAREVGAEADLELVSLTVKPHAVNRELAAAGPLAKIPTLLMPDGESVYDSRVICTRLVCDYDGRKLYGEGNAQQLISERQQALCDGICDAAVSLQYEKVFRPEEKRWEDLMQRLRARIMAGVRQLETERDALSSDRIGGLAAVIALDYLDFRHDDLKWRTACPDLEAWYKTNADRPSLKTSKPA